MVDLMIDMTEEPIDEDDFEFLLTNEYIDGIPYLSCPIHLDNSEEYQEKLGTFIEFGSLYGKCFMSTPNTVAFLRP